MIWKPAKTLGLVSGLIIGLTIFTIGALLLTTLASQTLGLSLFLSILLFVIALPFFAVWAYWYFCLLTLRYDLDRNRLMIRSAGTRHVIPMAAIERVVRGSDLTITDEFRGVNWPGYYRGRVQTAEHGDVHVYGSRPFEQQLIIVTDSLCYGLSPGSPGRFLEDLQARQALGAIRELPVSLERTGIASWPIWSDRLYWALCLFAATSGAILMALVLSQLRSTSAGTPSSLIGQGPGGQFTSRNWLLLVPGIGALSWLVNSLLGLALYRRERPAAYLLVLGSLCVQIIVWVAALGIFR